MGRFDPYLIRYIMEFLKQCENCKCCDIVNYRNICCICRMFYCEKCSKNLLQYHVYHDETLHKHCNKCINIYFNY